MSTHSRVEQDDPTRNDQTAGACSIGNFGKEKKLQSIRFDIAVKLHTSLNQRWTKNRFSFRLTIILNVYTNSEDSELFKHTQDLYTGVCCSRSFLV